MPAAMTTFNSKSNLADRTSGLGEGYDQSRNLKRPFSKTDYSDDPSKIYEEAYIENYIDKDLRKPKKKKFKNQDILQF